MLSLALTIEVQHAWTLISRGTLETSSCPGIVPVMVLRYGNRFEAAERILHESSGSSKLSCHLGGARVDGIMGEKFRVVIELFFYLQGVCQSCLGRLTVSATR